MKNKHLTNLTKRYIIDLLNGMFFENTITWDGDDNFNKLFILKSDEDTNDYLEQRACFFVHKKLPIAFRVVVTAIEKANQSVCYRLVSLEKELKIDDVDVNRIVKPTETKLDFSISDLNIGIKEMSSYSFCDNMGESRGRMLSLLKFLLDSEIIVSYDRKMFDDLEEDILSYPPISGDGHYKPIFGKKNDY